MSKNTFQNSDYWEDRIANETWKTYNTAEEKNIDLINMYQKALNQIKVELLELSEKAERDGMLGRTEQYRFDKLIGQQGLIYKEIEKLGDSVEQIASNNMKDAMKDVYDNIMVSFGVNDFDSIDKKMMENIMRRPWHGSFFSERLWRYMGKLEQALNGVISDGIATGKTITEMAFKLSDIMHKSFNDAHRLIRTETINSMNRSALKAYENFGVEKVQWCAAIDERKCKDCGAQHGTIYQIKKAPILPCHPGCRCTWLPVVEDELSSVKDSEEQWIEKDKNYLNESEHGIVANTSRIGTNEVDLKYIKSSDYRNKFSRITTNSKVNDVLRKRASALLTSHKGTDTESLIIFDANDGSVIFEKIGRKNQIGVALTADEVEFIKNYPGNKIGMHNHPTNVLPTGSDFVVAGYREYDFGLVIAHDGRIFMYSAGKKAFRPELLDGRIDKYKNLEYNTNINDIHAKVLDEFRKEYGIEWKEIK